jgi:hypothetical protein
MLLVTAHRKLDLRATMQRALELRVMARSEQEHKVSKLPVWAPKVMARKGLELLASVLLILGLKVTGLKE